MKAFAEAVATNNEEALKTIAIQAGFAYRLVDSTYIVTTADALASQPGAADQASAVLAFKVHLQRGLGVPGDDLLVAARFISRW